MDKSPEIEGKYIFDADTKRYHRFFIKFDDADINGSLYISKNRKEGERLPRKIILHYQDKEVTQQK